MAAILAQLEQRLRALGVDRTLVRGAAWARGPGDAVLGAAGDGSAAESPARAEGGVWGCPAQTGRIVIRMLSVDLRS